MFVVAVFVKIATAWENSFSYYHETFEDRLAMVFRSRYGICQTVMVCTGRDLLHLTTLVLYSFIVWCHKFSKKV